MADSTLDALTAASAIDGTELLYTDQAGADRKATSGALMRFGVANGVNAAGTIPNFMNAARLSDDASPTTLRIIGIGSSVGLGDTLPTASTQAPVAKLAEYLGAAVNGGSNLTISVTNASIGGTAVIDGVQGDYADAKTAAEGAPHLLVLAYGMNDGTPALYHNGQTFTGFYTQLVNLIGLARADGADVVILTSPHPHSTRQDWSYGGSIVYPSGGTAIPALTDEGSVITRDWLGDGRSIPASVRHARINAAMRLAAITERCALIDAEPYWFDAIGRLGEDALFNPGEYVHPNLTGHQESYWKAIEDWAKSMQTGHSPVALLPDAPIKVRDVVVSSGGTQAIDVLPNSRGELTIKATAGGSWFSIWKGAFVSSSGAVAVAEYGTAFITPGNAIDSVAGSGSALEITVTVEAVGTSINMDYDLKYDA